MDADNPPKVQFCMTLTCGLCYPMVKFTSSMNKVLPASKFFSVYTFLCTPLQLRGGLVGEMDAQMTAETKLRICSCLCASQSHNPQWFHLRKGPWDALPDLVNQFALWLPQICCILFFSGSHLPDCCLFSLPLSRTPGKKIWSWEAGSSTMRTSSLI